MEQLQRRIGKRAKDTIGSLAKCEEYVLVETSITRVYAPAPPLPVQPPYARARVRGQVKGRLRFVYSEVTTSR